MYHDTRGELRDRSSAVRHAGLGALFGFAIFGLFWLLYTPIRAVYVPYADDISVLADGLLGVPDAHWQNWFTQGNSRYFDSYPDWPVRGGEATDTAFTRPAFEFLIYLAHFLLGRNWALYQLINCFAVAGMGVVAFQIAQAVLGLRTGPSLAAALLVVLSPPVLESWLLGLAFANEPLATIAVASTFLAVVARRDFLCLALLFLGLLIKETTVWAPFAAAITIVLRPKPDESLRRRVFTAAAMLLPVAMWLGLRFAFFGGIGGTHATEAYTSLVELLKLAFYKLTHVHHLLIAHAPQRPTELLIQLNRGTALLIYALLLLWALSILPEAVSRFRSAMGEKRWPTVDAVLLVSLWALLALAFHLALPLSRGRYATSVVVFAWPALVAELEKRGKTIGVAVCCAVSVAWGSYYLTGSIGGLARNEDRNKIRSMNAELRQAPPGTRQIYVLSAGSLQEAHPEDERFVLGVSPEIVRVVEIAWHCHEASDVVVFDHSTANGVVSMTVTLPACAYFDFFTNRFDDAITNGRLYRNGRMSYEWPEARPGRGGLLYASSFDLGRRMTVHVRPTGPARFIVEHGRSDGIGWFDTP